MARLDPEHERLLAQWRAQGLTIVFTNGVFDLLHPGHLHVLEQARAMGDVLVVGLNTDESVQKLGKGEERPILEHQARAKLLSALRVVDVVLLFDEETPLELLKLVKPDVLVKGGDYQEHEVVGRELVNSWGGRVELVSLCPGYSTSGMISRIRGQ